MKAMKVRVWDKKLWMKHFVKNASPKTLYRFYCTEECSQNDCVEIIRTSVPNMWEVTHVYGAPVSYIYTSAEVQTMIDVGNFACVTAY